MNIITKSKYELDQDVFAIQMDYNHVHADSTPRYIYNVERQPVKIKHIRVTVEATGKTRIEYYTNLGWYPEHHLFATHADAAKYVHEKNN